jgi:hypothetical protein
MQSYNQASGIHCKVATRNEVRRFVLSNTDYESLINQVCQVFGFSKDSVVIKYADDEGDFITVSSDEEVKFAIEAVKGVFRLRVEQKHPIHHRACVRSPSFAVAPEVFHPENDDDESEEDKSESSGDHPKWLKKHHHHERMLENPAALEKCLQRMKQKRVKLQEKLVYLDSAAEKGNIGNGQHRHREKLRGKVAFISSRIERLTEVASRQARQAQQPQQQTTTSSPLQHNELPQQQLPLANTGLPVPATNLSGPMTMPNKEELLAEYETLQNSVTSLKFALREAHLQLQLRRTNLQAAMYRRNDESSVSPVGPLLSEEQVKELKDALATAKANEAAAKADLKAQVQKLHLVQYQLKAFKHSEMAGWKAKKAEKWQEKAAWKAEKRANKHQHPRCRRNWNDDHDFFPESSPVVQGSVSV